jgi:H3 lysine-79-specific histone-lysine N-methyltransferase
MRCGADRQHHPKHPDEVADAITAKEDAYGELRHE